MTTVVDFVEVAGAWRIARRIYPVYSVMARSLELPVGPCRELESPIDRSEPQVLERVNNWLGVVDEKVEVHQLRQILQTTHVATEENLRDLLIHQLSRDIKSPSVRDKVDYLCVQYYAHCAAHDSHLENVHSLAQVAEVLTPILGDLWQVPQPPAFADELENLVRELEQCASFADLIQRKIIERGRVLKDRAGVDYYTSASLIAFARFNYLVRRGFFRLMHIDLHTIRMGLHELECRGIQTVECAAAGFSQAAPIEALRKVCDEWKSTFQQAYSAERNFKEILEILKAVNAAVAMPPSPAAEVPKPQQDVTQTACATGDPVPCANAAAAAAQNAGPLWRGISAQNQVTTTAPSAPKIPPVPRERVMTPVSQLEDCLEQIAVQLIHAPLDKVSMSTVLLGTSKLMIASWEVAAFMQGDDDLSESLQRAVAARALLQSAMEEKKHYGSADLTTAISVAHAEAAMLQEKVAEAKDAKNIDASVNLAATAQRLLATIDQAEKN